MSFTRRTGVAAAVAATLLSAGQLVATPAAAEPVVDQPQPPVIEPAPAPDLLHNVTYRARADGTSRGAVVAYKADDQNVNSEQPTLLPGQTFEVNTVLDDPNLAGMELSIDWPYGSNLHCEILVDDQVVAKADQFIAPRLMRPKDDPLYGLLQCGAPLNIPIPGVNLPTPAPAAPTDPAAPAPEPAPAV